MDNLIKKLFSAFAAKNGIKRGLPASPADFFSVTLMIKMGVAETFVALSHGDVTIVGEGAYPSLTQARYAGFDNEEVHNHLFEMGFTPILKGARIPSGLMMETQSFSREVLAFAYGGPITIRMKIFTAAMSDSDREDMVKALNTFGVDTSGLMQYLPGIAADLREKIKQGEYLF